MNPCRFALKYVCSTFSRAVRMRYWGAFPFYAKTYMLGGFQRIQPDAYVVSYPKCGRTWLRTLLRTYVHATGSSLHFFWNRNVCRLPGGTVVAFDHDKGNWVPAPRSAFTFAREKYASTGVVFLVRDPRDVLVSSYHHLSRRDRVYTNGLSSFVRDRHVGIGKIIRFMNMWSANKDLCSRFLIVTYEQLHADTAETFDRVVRFLGLPVDRNALDTAVAQSSFERMKRMEREGVLNEPWMRAERTASRDAMKVRRGRVGGYRDVLSPRDIAYVDTVVREELASEFPYR